MKVLILIALCLCLAAPIDAQETPLTYDVPVTGRIDAATPSSAYVFEGLRGEVVTVTLRVTDGDLDPVVLVIDDAGTPLAFRDDGGTSSSGGTVGSDVRVQFVRIPRSARYTVIVARFGYTLGTTSGSYELLIEREGVSFASGSALRYGDSVYNTITDMTPQVYYSFRAARGDVINVRMQRVSGDLDPFIQVVNSQGLVIAENDDAVGGGTLDSQITALLIEQDGMYAIVASRFGQAAGRSRGSFVLTLQTAAQSGIGSTAETAFPLLPGEVVQGELNDDRFVQFYRFAGTQDEIVSVEMSRASGNLDTFIVLADANLQELIVDDDSGGGQNSAIRDFVLPADGTYYLIATRYQRAQGTTSGGFSLQLSSAGSAFAGAAEGAIRIGYGTTITGRIDDDTTTILYAFYGREGDIITAAMSRADGDLDSFLSVLDANLSPLVSDDDSGTGQDARIDRFTLPATGVYYLAATRFSAGDSGTPGNPTRGSFILVLARLLE